MPVKDHKSSFRLLPSVRLFISQFCHGNAQSPGRCFIQHLSQLPFHVRKMGITTPTLLIPVRTSASEGAQNTRALHLPFLEGLRQILPGLSPHAPRRPPLRPPRGRPFPHPTTEGLLSHGNAAPFHPGGRENNVPPTLHPGQEGRDAGPKPALGITKPRTVHQPGLQGKRRGPQPPFRTEEKLLKLTVRTGNRATPLAAAERLGLRTDAEGCLASPPSSALRPSGAQKRRSSGAS